MVFVLLIHLREIVQHVVYVLTVSLDSFVNVPYFPSIHVQKIHVDLTVLVFELLIPHTIVFVQMVSLDNRAIPVNFFFFNILLIDYLNSGTFSSCSSSPCRYLSTCQQIENTNPPSYKCLCPDYLTGDRCQYTNACQKQPCLNQGSCIPLGPQNNFMCLCSSGFGHYDCSICKI
jgi:hypothetical protein